MAKGSKIVFPHHTFYRACGLVVVFGVALGIVHAVYLPFYGKVNQLSNGHARIYAYRLYTGNFQCPSVAKTYIAFTCRRMDIYAQASGAAFAL